jgi:hypothetical protein
MGLLVVVVRGMMTYRRGDKFFGWGGRKGTNMNREERSEPDTDPSEEFMLWFIRWGRKWALLEQD